LTLQHFNRRLHLYLGLALLPWLFMYGVSAIPFAHNVYFNARDAATGLPEWHLREERVVELTVPDDAGELRAVGAQLLSAAAVDVPNFNVSRPNRNRLVVTGYSFWNTSRLTYAIDTGMLTVEDRRFRWAVFFRGLHERSGFQREGVLQTSWSVILDLVCVAIVVWVASGLYMWWGLRGHRAWGLLALLAGAGSFAVFTFGL
jgi:hypothetical protein